MASSTPNLRIAIVSLHTSPLARLGSRDAGGMNVYVDRLARELGQQGMPADVFTRREDTHAADIVEVAEGYRVIHIPAGPARPISKSCLPMYVDRFVEGMRSFVDQHDVDYDLLHSHYWLSGLAAMRFRGSRELPLAHMFHTLARVKEFYQGRPDPSDTLHRLDGERVVAREADAIVGATPEEERLLEKLYGVTPRSYYVIPPGIDVEQFRPHDREASRRRLRVGKERVLLFVGRTSAIKGFDLLVDVLAEHREDFGRFKLLVVGGYGDEKHRHTVGRLGLDHVVDFRGIVRQSDMSYYYSAANLTVVPSAYESFGMTAVESLACSTPVVAFGAGGLATTIRHRETGFLARPGDRSDFALQLREALEYPYLDAMGSRGRLTVQRFDWPTIARRNVTMYHSLVEQARCQSRAAGEA